jgi:hypothetical protein
MVDDQEFEAVLPTVQPEHWANHLGDQRRDLRVVEAVLSELARLPLTEPLRLKLLELSVTGWVISACQTLTRAAGSSAQYWRMTVSAALSSLPPTAAAE